MTETKKISEKPNWLFEVSWEVCNKVGGIHTVVSTKALEVTQQMGDNYILIGPDISREGKNPEFTEDPNLFKSWKQVVYAEGIRIRIGRWNVKGNPIVVLVDFSSFFAMKDDVLKFLWETYRVDSISGQWDYIEPVLFGYAAAKVIDSYVDTFSAASDKIVAHFHEWMTSSGGLYLRKYSPYIATVFTTHATVIGRSIAGNGLPLYSDLEQFHVDDLARQFNVTAKHSLEKTAAANFDAFLTVSDLTARECQYLLKHEVDKVTPNGFEDDFVWKGKDYNQKRDEARALILRVAEASLGYAFGENTLIVGTSGRYEFKNKGLDVLLESLKQVAADEADERDILVCITVPAGNNGPRKDLLARLADPNAPLDPAQCPFTTHVLSEPEWDPIVQSVRGSLLEDASKKVKLLFVPSYLNGDDGVFNKSYYEILIGMDLTVYASYYEPWGYTPLESVAFGLPTVTTTLSGFGLWVDQHLPAHAGIEVIPRNDTNDHDVIETIATEVRHFRTISPKEYAADCQSAYKLSKIALWEHLIEYYWDAYRVASQNASARSNRVIREGMPDYSEQISFVHPHVVQDHPTWTRLQVEKSLPERLHALEKLSHNLWWSWTLGGHALFEYIDLKLWQKCLKNPIDFLNRLDYTRLKELERDQEFLDKMDAVYAEFQQYMDEKKEAKGPKIAYFCMEYGLLNFLKIFSGGLGILAGDYLKEASDKNVPMVAVGLLYRYGYFKQQLSAQGTQEASYEPQDFHNLPIAPVRDAAGNWSSIHIAFPGRTVTARIWKCEVGRTDLYLLDTDHDLNFDEDRSITHYLYGGDWENRLKQEILLGIGGIRTLNELGIEQDVYHCNEGHAAFIGVERINNLVNRRKLLFGEALEVVRSSSLFTTHTPVPAGHDSFPESMIRQYMSHYPDRLMITWEQYFNLGRVNPNDPNEPFSMSVLASNLSQEINGVSQLHGEVTKEILGRLWPGYFKNELHIGYVTNGVHFPSWAAPNLRKLYARYFPKGFQQHDYDIGAWQKANDIDDEELWKERIFLKNKLVNYVRNRLGDPSQAVLSSPGQMVRIMETFKPDVLTIGFARRFATYKRANLIFSDLDRLASILNNPDRPVQFVFAGKAHPNDKPGQDLIKRILEVAVMPQFAGKIVFLQNYDMAVARKMVQGVDVWLNTPIRRQEASGTSGEKAVMNGVLQFSVLDGWWVEGYKEGAGWMLPLEKTFAVQEFQSDLDAELIYSTIEDQIAPMYYNRDEKNIPHDWVTAMKKCIAEIASNFTTNRMLKDYEERFYGKLYDRSRQAVADDFRMAREIAAWKHKVNAAWDKVNVVDAKQFDMSKEAIKLGHPYRVEVTIDIDGLSPEDVGAELVIANQIDQGEVVIKRTLPLKVEHVEGTVVRYAGDVIPTFCGTFDMAIRVFPKNPQLPYRMDFPLVKWV